MAAQEIPKSIIIVGSGVFGLSTALALAKRKDFVDANSDITVLERLEFPAQDGSSVDSSRVIRAEYADPAYAELMAEAYEHWRGDWGKEGRYTEAGLCIVMDDQPNQAHEYMRKAVVNVRDGMGLKEGPKEQGGQVELLNSASAVKRVMSGMRGDCGDTGYINWTAGWAHATDALVYARQQALETQRVKFMTAQVKRLHFSTTEQRVTSVELASGAHMTADLIILAAGAWTPSLIDLRGIASATGQILTYLTLTPTEQTRLGANPTLLNASNGMFIIQPRDHVLKVARHGYGYANPVRIPHPEKDATQQREDDPDAYITVSLPRTATTTHPDARAIPAEGLRVCRDFLARTNPDLQDREFVHTRLCWYTDTPTGEWLVGYHPRYARNLFVATGGSGHGYKFLPVLGERVVDVILGTDRDDLGRRLRQKWKWPEEKFREDHIWTNDWRGGVKGMVLDDEFAKS